MSMKKLVSMFAMLAVFGLSASLTGCGGDEDEPVPTETGGDDDTGTAGE